jgi:cellulose synthase (UDP-forming)
MPTPASESVPSPAPERRAPVLLSLALVLTLLAVFAYLITRTWLFFVSDYGWLDRTVAGVLLLAESFILVHSLGYFLNILHVVRKVEPGAVDPATAPLPVLDHYPPVAIIVSSYKEPLAVIEDTLTCFANLTYPNKYLYFLDDTRYDLPNQDATKMAKYRADVDAICRRLGINNFRRKWHGAKAGMINDWLDWADGQMREGFQFQPFQGRARPEKEKYVVVFDADMNAFPDFVEHLVAVMEARPKLAFVQTPQYYTNFDVNRVARAAGLQQAVFYEYICEGKSSQDAMFCCGTNVMFRREALMAVGGFDHTSITEDFATSLKFHLQGWSSCFLNRVCAFGLGPEDLGGYFKQQFRWALGTVGLFRTIATAFVKNPRALPFVKWWEYALSGTHYFVGWTFFVLCLCPIIYLLFGVPTFFARPEVFLMVFAPYIAASLGMFIYSLRRRRYRAGEIFTALLLNNISFPVYMKASFLGAIGVRGSFGITPKGQSASMPLRTFWPQLGLALVSFIAVVWGLHQLYYVRQPVAALAVNSFWCAYHLLILATTLYFNWPEVEMESPESESAGV